MRDGTQCGRRQRCVASRSRGRPGLDDAYGQRAGGRRNVERALRGRRRLPRVRASRTIRSSTGSQAALALRQDAGFLVTTSPARDRGSAAHGAATPGAMMPPAFGNRANAARCRSPRSACRRKWPPSKENEEGLPHPILHPMTRLPGLSAHHETMPTVRPTVRLVFTTVAFSLKRGCSTTKLARVWPRAAPQVRRDHGRSQRRSRGRCADPVRRP